MINVTKKGLYCSRWLGNKRTNVDVFIFNGKGHGSLYRWFITRHTHMHTQCSGANKELAENKFVRKLYLTQYGTGWAGDVSG